MLSIISKTTKLFIYSKLCLADALVYDRNARKKCKKKTFEVSIFGSKFKGISIYETNE